MLTPGKRDMRPADQIALDVIEAAGLRLASGVDPFAVLADGDSADEMDGDNL